MNEVFGKLVTTDCSKHVEKKGRYSYLSWPWAVRMLLEVDPAATWEVVRFEGLPYMVTPAGYFVEVCVTAGGIARSQIHPVLNERNRPIAQPTSFDINTSIQRCLVKAIALHGLGLYIYGGEDLPTGNEERSEDADDPPAGDAEAMTEKQLADLKASMDECASLEDLQKQTRHALSVAAQLMDIEAHASIKAHGIQLSRKWVKTSEREAV